MKCDSPLSIRYDPPLPDGKGGFIYWFPADCGKCMPCLVRRKAQWSFRMTEEKREAFSSYFVTLTYDDKNVPYGDDGYCINKNDHFQFIADLKFLETRHQLGWRENISKEEYNRKKLGVKERGKKLKYYAVSEYGDRFGRPHWHYILFNLVDIRNIDQAWTKGKVQIDDCNVNTIDYVLKYMIKDRSEDPAGRWKESSFMSKGIGKCVVNDEFVKYIGSPQGNQVINERGYKVALPRYYRKLLKKEELEAKAVYINGVNEEKDIKLDKEFDRLKLNRDFIESRAKDMRFDLIKKRRKRNLE